MKPIVVLTTAVLTAALATACARDADTNANTDTAATSQATDAATTDTSTDPAMPAEPMPGAMALNEITGLVAANDQLEIEAADQASSKKVTGKVKAYAEMLHPAHTANLAATRTVGEANQAAPSDSGPVAMFKEKGKADLATLAALDGKAYEKAYVDAKVKGHTEVLAKLDNELIPATTNDAVKAHLVATRGHVVAHLEQGKALQASMN